MRYGPRVSELWAQGDTAQLIRVTRMVTVTTTLFAAATCAAILLLAPWILGIFGKAFTANAAALGWIAAAQMFSVACGPAGLLLTMSGHPSRALAGHLAGLSVNVALGLWLIPQHGAHGAAQAMAGGTVVLNLVMLVGVRRHLGFDPSLAGLLQLFRQSGH
jgi:O-antigen/teichoic acid export membrane protein